MQEVQSNFLALQLSDNQQMKKQKKPHWTQITEHGYLSA